MEVKMRKSEIVNIKDKLKKINVHKIINASEFYEKYAGNINEPAFYKMLERMTKSGELVRLAKGLYYKPKVTNYGVVPISDNEIINYYVKNRNGMVIGYLLFNSKGITTQISQRVEILSNRLTENKKQVANISVIRVDLNFDESFVAMIEILEILEELKNIEDVDYGSFQKYIDKAVLQYSDTVVDKILKIRKYKKSTIYLLHTILEYYKVENHLNKYLSALSQYKVVDIRRMYESA